MENRLREHELAYPKNRIYDQIFGISKINLFNSKCVRTEERVAIYSAHRWTPMCRLDNRIGEVWLIRRLTEFEFHTESLNEVIS